MLRRKRDKREEKRIHAFLRMICQKTISILEVKGISMGGLVKNQHYIPQCVLARFSNEKSQVYEVLVDSERPPYITKCKNSMVERFTYEHPDIEKNQLEKYFSRIESYFGPAIVNIERMIDEHGIGELTNSQLKKSIEKYMREVIIFYYRSGALLHEFEFQRVRKQDRIGLMLENIMNSPYIKRLSRTITEKYSFAIIKSDDKDFLLSDQYLTTVALGIKNRFLHISNRHMGLKDVLILIPISSQYYIAYFHGNTPEYIKTDRINLLNEGQVMEINKAIINNSYIKCIGENRQGLVDAHKSFVISSPSSTIAGFKSGAVTGATLKKEVFFYEKDQKTWDLFISHEFMKYKNIGRNESCKCGSGLKFKKCCFDNFLGAERMMNDIVNRRSDYALVRNTDIEKGIGEF
ncbi:DUF4238 domain-containing protein [Paenibacillus sp. NRS-1783]|uniref:DUF4238 domain-containing protein n=1 Tax=unclassified Paenibacillus TaxID=185978 RepID=UPI003D2C8B36